MDNKEYKRYEQCKDESERYTLDLPYVGICSFGKNPICSNLDELDADVAIIGMPFEESQWRGGSKMGPRGIRDASTLYALGLGGSYDPERDEMYLGNNVKIVDCGDVEMIHGDVVKNLQNIEDAVKKIVAKGAIPVGIGGDHTVSIPFCYGLEDLGPFNVIQIDAHLDFANNKSGQRWGQGSPMRRMSEMAHVDKMWNIGIRGIGSSKRTDFEDARNYGCHIISPKELRKMGIQNLINSLPEGEKYYISFDIDGMDASIAGGTGTPAAGGLYYDEVSELFEGIAKRGEVVGFDLLEVTPGLDPNQATCLLASRLILDFIMYITKEKERKGTLKAQQK